MRTGRRILSVIILAVTTAFLPACGPARKIESIRRQDLAATLALSRNEIQEERKVIAVSRRDTLTVQDEDGKTILVMKAQKDQVSGEMVATDVLDAAVITARFRNVAERNGKIDLRFEIIVPSSLQDSRWQLRFYPDMFIRDDSLRLEPVLITGEQYRRNQLKGYQQYDRFLSSIITDDAHFIDRRNLDIFVRRNLSRPYGVSDEQALEHYTNQLGKSINERRKQRKEEMFARYVKSPIVTEGIRLDTVIQNASGEFVYHYTQTIRTQPRLRKVDIVLSGDIFEADQCLYTMSRSQPLTFYISSLSTLADGTEHYLTRRIERKAAVHTTSHVDFRTGRYDVDPRLGDNAQELSGIRETLLQLLTNESFEVDSVVIGASTSPEGSVGSNDVLSKKRAASIAAYCDQFIRHYRDSTQKALDRQARNTFTISVADDGTSTGGRAAAPKVQLPRIPFRSHSLGENWEMLSLLVDQDSTLRPEVSRSYMKLLGIKDLDLREKAMQKEPYYSDLRERLYPRLRTVRFDFHLHRRGMLQDSIVRVELDTVYMKGVAALQERDYRKALTYLRDYRDYNTAIAYVSMDYNASAMAILQELERTPPVLYMLAILYGRSGDDQKAVQCYLDACRQDPSYVFRGNLDPEIYILIQRYGLNRQDDEEI